MLGRTFRNRCMAVLSGFALIAALSAAPAQAESLVDTVQTAVSTYPSIDEAASNKRAQDYELKQQRGLYYPSLDVGAAIGPEWYSSHINKPESSMTRKESQATLSLLLFDGFARESSIERSASRVDAAASRVLERSEAVAASAAEAYLNMLRNVELLRLAEENLVTHQNLLGRVRARVAGGQSGQGDLQQANARVSSAEDNVLQARKDLRDARTAYIELVNLSPDNLEDVAPPLSALPANVDKAVALALRTSPTVAAAAADLDEANAAHRLAASGFYPTFRIDAGIARNDNTAGTPGFSHEASILLRMNWNLFRGMIDKNLRLETAERANQTRAAVSRLERSTAKEVRNSWTAMEIARDRSDVLDQHVIFEAQVVSTYRQEFEIGQRELLDLLDSENELFTIRTRAVTADFTHRYSVYRALAAVGILNSTLGVKVPVDAYAEARKGAGVKQEWTGPFIARQPGYEFIDVEPVPAAAVRPTPVASEAEE